MTQIRTLTGDATNPKRINPEAKVIIPHICNDIGKWGRGFVLALSNTFGESPQFAYLDWYREQINNFNFIEREYNVKIICQDKFNLGETQFVHLPSRYNNVCIANMVAQHGIRGMDVSGRPPIRYAALMDCMRQVANVAKNLNSEIHCAKFGSDLAGGSWTEIEKIIEEIWCDKDIPVTVYEFVPQTA